MAELPWTKAGKPKRCSLHSVIFLLIVMLVLVFFGTGVLNPRIPMLGTRQEGTGEAAGRPTSLQVVTLPRMVYPQPMVLTPSRKDVLVLTPWLAPIIWEGTFNIDILNEQFRQQNVTIGLTVFAIKK
ncbi:PREDICTED: histo-blood group ABO system transferase-like isoform X1 [Hipposideros armiger]|uniref:Histo-blood group ABO system transferase-like isoform X1 n=1 Tax=Hipposideros armiger TaxID=186990 RepID=A0A8B7R2G6_HIPAR|nr:PREDICTED: histo-blood group ABO system transferase-like isoform X1 [Hipposideros armiger]